MPIPDDERYASLVQALTAIASGPAEQTRLLPSLSRVASEMRRAANAEGLDVQQLTREGVLPAEVGFSIARIEEVLDELVEDPSGSAFTEHALRTNARWKLARMLAREALEQLGERRRSSRILPDSGDSS